MRADRIASLETFAIRLPRDQAAAIGAAGSPTTLAESRFDYRWSTAYPALYSIHFEAALFKLTTESGVVGWGEAQAPLAPEVACSIADLLLRPAVEGEPFDGSSSRIRELWSRMYSTMRVRGQTGGFMLDAISGVDIALWDIAGKMAGRPTAELLAEGNSRTRIPAYFSGLSGATNNERVDQAREAWAQGFRTFKLFHDRDEQDLFDLFDHLRDALGREAKIAVDALWRLTEATATPFARKLDQRDALWLEAPLPPELADAHQQLARAVQTPLALGESYRTRYELAPFLERDAVQRLQPDLGRCGLTEAMEWARTAAESSLEITPHISIAMGPQIAAGVHFAAASVPCRLAEYNPKVFTIANRFLTDPLVLDGARYRLPEGAGLGISVNEDAVRAAAAHAHSGLVRRVGHDAVGG